MLYEQAIDSLRKKLKEKIKQDIKAFEKEHKVSLSVWVPNENQRQILYEEMGIEVEDWELSLIYDVTQI